MLQATLGYHTRSVAKSIVRAVVVVLFVASVLGTLKDGNNADDVVAWNNLKLSFGY